MNGLEIKCLELGTFCVTSVLQRTDPGLHKDQDLPDDYLWSKWRVPMHLFRHVVVF
jgi:hypothetical protein